MSALFVSFLWEVGHFFLGLVIGAISVGAITWRTLAVFEGKVAQTLVSSVLISISYIFGVSYVVTQEWVGYLGFSLGAALVTGLMAYRNKLIIEEKKHNGRRD